MTVSDLIKYLEEFDQDKEVLFLDSEGIYETIVLAIRESYVDGENTVGIIYKTFPIKTDSGGILQ